MNLENQISEGFIKKKNGVGFLQPLSVYLPTPIGVQKAIFLVFFACFEKTIFDEKKFFCYQWAQLQLQLGLGTSVYGVIWHHLS